MILNLPILCFEDTDGELQDISTLSDKPDDPKFIANKGSIQTQNFTSKKLDFLNFKIIVFAIQKCVRDRWKPKPKCWQRKKVTTASCYCLRNIASAETNRTRFVERRVIRCSSIRRSSYTLKQIWILNERVKMLCLVNFILLFLFSIKCIRANTIKEQRMHQRSASSHQTATVSFNHLSNRKNM